MQLTLDAKQMGECLDLWRETLEARFEDEMFAEPARTAWLR
jgi:hypothetical protein